MNPDDEQRVNDAVQRGEYASKGAARRAFGINEGVPPVGEPLSSWAEKLNAGLSHGRFPTLPNCAGQPLTRPTRRRWQFWKRVDQ